jgi:hypothetical protein
MLHRYHDPRFQEFTLWEFFLVLGLNLGLVVACLYGFQTAYKIEAGAPPFQFGNPIEFW